MMMKLHVSEKTKQAWKKENPDAVIEKADEEVIERAVENSTQRKEEKAQFVAPPMPDVD